MRLTDRFETTMVMGPVNAWLCGDLNTRLVLWYCITCFCVLLHVLCTG